MAVISVPATMERHQKSAICVILLELQPKTKENDHDPKE